MAISGAPKERVSLLSNPVYWNNLIVVLSIAHLINMQTMKLYGRDRDDAHITSFSSPDFINSLETKASW